MREPIDVDLCGVPETLLGNLGRRAAAARVGALNDPMAIRIVSQLAYDFTSFARGARWHAVRVATFDRAVRHFLDPHPLYASRGNVVEPGGLLSGCLVGGVGSPPVSETTTRRGRCRTASHASARSRWPQRRH